MHAGGKPPNSSLKYSTALPLQSCQAQLENNPRAGLRTLGFLSNQHKEGKKGTPFCKRCPPNRIVLASGNEGLLGGPSFQGVPPTRSPAPGVASATEPPPGEGHHQPRVGSPSLLPSLIGSLDRGARPAPGRWGPQAGGGPRLGTATLHPTSSPARGPEPRESPTSKQSQTKREDRTERGMAWGRAPTTFWWGPL